MLKEIREDSEESVTSRSSSEDETADEANLRAEKDVLGKLMGHDRKRQRPQIEVLGET